ncbi:OmpA family protein [Roseomonas eburnea]|uniref:OmpA family protein n=1 Tax=Neoroseomonas eburnea TaxID=1346889 RepID=A0A9X9XKJ4_9PROT|nr:OmpA family protein [Neoroseomonas eburnea]MBR0684230.1 OmpA family protein [Neoroseomonas eburnea]
MRGLLAGMLGLLALAAAPARAQGFPPDGAVILFAPGSAEIGQAGRDVVLAFLRPPRPPGFRGHCLRGHADRGAGAQALSLERARAVAAMMARQGVDPADVVVEAAGDLAPARLAPPGRTEPMNDRVELVPCPGPRLAGMAEAEARALDAAVVPAFVTALAPRIARAMGCAVPQMPRWALVAPPFACPAEVPPQAVPALTVRRVDGSRRVAVTLEWPAGIPAGEARQVAAAAAGAVLDLFGHAPAAPVLAALAAEAGAARHLAFLAGASRAEVEAGPGEVRRLRVVAGGGDGP